MMTTMIMMMMMMIVVVENCWDFLWGKGEFPYFCNIRNGLKCYSISDQNVLSDCSHGRKSKRAFTPPSSFSILLRVYCSTWTQTNLVICRKLLTSCYTQLHCFSTHFIIHIRVLKNKYWVGTFETIEIFSTENNSLIQSHHDFPQTHTN